MKFTDFVAKQATENPKYKGKPTDEVADDLYSQAMQRQKTARDELAKLKAKHAQPKETVDILLTPEGELKSSKNLTFKGEQYNTSEKLFTSKALRDLANLVRPLIGVTRAVIRSGEITQQRELHVLDSENKRTSDVLKDKSGNVLYNVDPLSQLKMLTYILENNEETAKALATIAEALKGFNGDRMREAAVTKDVIQAKMPVKPAFRDASGDTKSLKNAAAGNKPVGPGK